ncbi:general secretion pathway protein D [Neorhodopirellula lusitana]|uniref:General secretion pathway protein D n=2 Tax=Neorhodopirellula lusitana TaxID=445327 RepID=A0ABY1QR95_9BACT|nr:general secretion pathway protein D [Neorhodopirellula lusitana]
MNRSYHPPRRKGSSPVGSNQATVNRSASQEHSGTVVRRTGLGRLRSRIRAGVLSPLLVVPLGCITTMSTVEAQFSFPTSPSPTQPAAPSTASPAVMPIDGLLQQLDSAMSSSDFALAIRTYRAASGLLASGQISDSANATVELRKRHDQMVARGVDAGLLQAPAATQATPNSLAQRQQETRRLTAMGRVALDRGDVSGAYALATQAQSIGLAQNEFAPGDARPWQLLLDTQAAARRSGIDLSNVAANPAANPIAQVAGTMPLGQAGYASQSGYQTGSANPNGIAQAGGQPNYSTPYSIQPVQALGSSDNAGVQLFQEGMTLLSSGKQVEARAKFVDAWKYESTLPTDTRRALQDKLTLLQPTRMPSAGTPDKPLTPIQKADMAAAQAVKRLYREITTELAKANEKKETAPLDAEDDLKRLARKVEGANIDEASKASLSAMVGRALSEQTAYVEANRAKIQLDLNNEAVRTEMDTANARELRIDDEISSLVETFNDLMEENRFQEAEVIAKQVQELKPDSPIATSLFHSSRTQVRIQMDEEILAQSEDGFARHMLAVGAAAIAPDPDRPFSFQDPTSWEELSRRRLASGDSNSRLSPREQEIKRKLSSDVELKYRNRPLGEVLDDLSAVTGVPIAIDSRALAAVRVTRDTPVSKSINNRISLQSALNLLLDDMDLTFVLKNDVLNITSREARRTMTETRTYRVADLVTPIPNFISGYEHGLSGALKSAYQMVNPSTDVHVVPVSMTDLGGGMANNRSSSMGKNMLGQYNPMGNGGGFSGGLGAASAMSGGRGGGSMADFDSLMQLIQQTIEPDTWEALGGVGTMAPYPQNLSLVISTTSDVHDQIVDLLESLRRLQNLQITIEVRFITLADTFFEQIGVDFDIRFDDNATSIPADDSGSAVTIGLDAQGTPTADLDIRLDQNTVGAALPPFGAPDTGSISTIGFAILSDIEAFFFLQAAQGDTRSNIMQAPKVTLFDGQIASINDTLQRPFVTSIVPVVGDFAVAQQPVIVVLDEGTRLNVQGVVSDDKRFVRLTLVPTFSQIGEVNTFTYEGNRTTSNSSSRTVDTNGDGVINEDDDTEEEEIVQGTTVQQPTFASTSVSTTVSVPDGGTILLGGIKRMSEGRNERGVPFLSKIPYVSRLFRNVGVGRTSTSLMLMVTPRIIIQEEEEIAQTGFDPNR